MRQRIFRPAHKALLGHLIHYNTLRFAHFEQRVRTTPAESGRMATNDSVRVEFESTRLGWAEGQEPAHATEVDRRPTDS